MLEINVFFKAGKVVEIDQEIAGVHSGDSVIWNFHSVDNTNVKWAEVEFTKPPAKFFEDRSGSPPSPRCYTNMTGGHGHIIGTAPQFSTTPDSQLAKYSVRGHTVEPQQPGSPPWSERDPEIIICDP